MKKKLLLSLLLCLGLVVGGCSNGLVVGSVNGHRIYESDIKELMEYYFQMYGVTDPSDETYADFSAQVVELSLEMAVKNQIVKLKAEELGLSSLSDEEKAEVEKTVDDNIQSWKDAYYEDAKSANPDGTEEDWQKTAQETLDTEMKEADLTRDLLIQRQTDYVIEKKVYDSVTADVSVTDEEIQTEYDTRVAEMKENYTETPANYEQDTMYGSTIYYNPAGFRKIKHILISFESDDATEITTLQNSGDTEGAEKAKQTALSHIQEKAQGILNQLKKDGSNFDEIMKNNTDDTGSGLYYVGNLGDDTSYEASFTKAALALKKPGEISGLVASSYGYHILYYVEDVKEGAVPLADVKEYTKEQLLSTKKQNVYADQLEQWKSEYTVETYADRVDLTKYKTTDSTSLSQ